MPLLEKCYLLKLLKMEVDSSLNSSFLVKKNAQVQEKQPTLSNMISMESRVPFIYYCKCCQLPKS